MMPAIEEHLMKYIVTLAAMVILAFGAYAQEKAMEQSPPENTYVGELASFPGPWGFWLGRSCIILVSDEELEALSDPDKAINMALGFDKMEKSLRQVCEEAKAAGNRTLIIAFDHFFSQYRPLTLLASPSWPASSFYWASASACAARPLSLNELPARRAQRFGVQASACQVGLEGPAS